MTFSYTMHDNKMEAVVMILQRLLNLPSRGTPTTPITDGSFTNNSFHVAKNLRDTDAAHRVVTSHAVQALQW